MIELVIKIDEELYNDMKSLPFTTFAEDIIINGTLLPKIHGRLIDADWVKNTLDIYVINEYNGQFIRRSDIDTIPTIIEAEGSEN